ncbi:hypothetical protein PR048_021865 [Dryococelus australis]|uniref:Uncharacterized protein n=1 Tax=Dryococelus australis TaxID=614101 RepID=A0ABQ9GZD8_9NEOP|nr:hypothetical protein PR048_021865 [Dryococelus australis]
MTPHLRIQHHGLQLRYPKKNFRISPTRSRKYSVLTIVLLKLRLSTLPEVYRLGAANLRVPALNCFSANTRTGFDSTAGSLPDFHMWELCHWSAGFLWDHQSQRKPAVTPLHSGAAPYPPHFNLIGSQDSDWFETRPQIGSKIDTENCNTILVQSWTGDRDEVHFEPAKLAVRNLDPRSPAIIDESEIQNREISLIQHIYIGTKFKLDPGSELRSFDLGLGKMLGLKAAETAALANFLQRWENIQRSIYSYSCKDPSVPDTAKRQAVAASRLTSVCGHSRRWPAMTYHVRAATSTKELSEDIRAALNIEVLRADEGKRETPEKPAYQRHRPKGMSGRVRIAVTQQPPLSVPKLYRISANSTIKKEEDKVNVKHVYTEVEFAIGSRFIRHSLDYSEPIADLQGDTADFRKEITSKCLKFHEKILTKCLWPRGRMSDSHLVGCDVNLPESSTSRILSRLASEQVDFKSAQIIVNSLYKYWPLQCSMFLSVRLPGRTKPSPPSSNGDDETVITVRFSKASVSIAYDCKRLRRLFYSDVIRDGFKMLGSSETGKAGFIGCSKKLLLHSQQVISGKYGKPKSGRPEQYVTVSSGMRV